MQTCAIQHVSRYPRGCGRILEEYNRCMWVNFEIRLQPPPWTTRVCALLKFPNGVDVFEMLAKFELCKKSYREYSWLTLN